LARGLKAQRRKTRGSRPDTAISGRDPLVVTYIEVDVCIPTPDKIHMAASL
jgi:hypothetical protein